MVEHIHMRDDYDSYTVRTRIFRILGFTGLKIKMVETKY
jgi:hypothetical protein